MVTIATADTEIALAIGGTIEGQRSYITRAKDETNLRHQVHRTQPRVLIMDARLGGNLFEALQGLPKISENVKSRPLTIVLLPDGSEMARSTAIELGAYEIVEMSNPEWLKVLADAVTDAHADRLAGTLPAAAQRQMITLH